ncbi:MAG TPA: YHS domain-containing protein [Candidatus Saccharibacteria bacterium]|nr:YHS domain-containing protein [Candidatus Saccharibacteria bacterium]
MHDHHDHEHHHGDAPAVDPATLDDTQAICPVTGDVVVKAEAKAIGHSRHHDGQTYYFCCATCVQLFDKNPEKYTHQTHSNDTLTLASKENLVGNVWAFRFKADTPILWTPGQFIRVELPHDNPDVEGTKRWFTISSTPHDGYTQITTRVTDTTFKQSLAALPIGDTINLVEQPDGDFVWQESDEPLVFVAGGIGITPFYSMLKARGHSGQPVSATLIYNGRTDDLPFKAEFSEASKQHPEFTVQYVIGEPLTAEKLTELVPDISSSQVFISGPEPMVETLGKQLEDNGLSSDSLHQDFFPHYSEANY